MREKEEMSMKCWKCGQEVGEGAKFCAACGADLTQPEPTTETPKVDPAPVPEAPKTTAGAPNVDGALILKIFAGVFAAVFAFFTLRGIWGLLGGIFSVFDFIFSGYFSVGMLIAWGIGMVVDILVLLSNVWMLAAMLLLLLKRTPENSDGLLVLAIGGVAVRAVVEVIALVIGLVILPILYGGFGMYVSAGLGARIGGILLRLLVAAVAAGGAYLIIWLVLGESPLAGKDLNALVDEGKAALTNLSQSANAALEKARAKSEANRAAQVSQAAPVASAPAAAGGANPPASYGGAHHMPTNRGLLVYILLNIVTCGIYSWYFIHAIARDMNIVCEGDGKRTAGLLKYFLLNLITCNIYSWVWYYGLGNRMAANAPRYGLNFQENGTTILLWMLLGALLCGIGPFIALHILLRNANTLCGAYNVRNGV